MNGTRQQIQYSLALEQADQGEAPVSGHQRTEPFVAKPAPASSAVTEQLMEEVCNRENLVRAWKRVRQNKGGPGVDGMTIDDAKDYLREHWPSSSTEKWSSDSSALTGSWLSTAAMNLLAMSPSIKRSRFLVNTVSSHTASSSDSPTNQRNSRL